MGILMISGRASRAVGEDTVEAALVGGDAQDQVLFAGADGLEAVQVVVEEEKELFGILVEEDMFVGAQAVEEAIAAGCVFALGGARAGGFLGILAVSIDLGLAGCARFIRIIPYAYWRAREARSFPLPYYWGGFGDSDGVLRKWLKTWGRDFLPGGDRKAASPVSRQNAKAPPARQESKRRSWSFIRGALCIKMVLMQIHTTLRILALALLLACHPHSGKCEAMLPGILSSHMVLQRERPIHIWGWSAPGEKVSVALDGISRDVVGNSLGNWSVFLPPEAAGGPYQLIVTGSNQIVLDDVLVGDVWFASGQSNMEMPLKGFPGAPLKDSAEEIAHAGQPQMRLLHIPHKAADFPLGNSDTSWTACSPETAATFSAVAYFFGRELSAREHVPIGLIDATWGGTVAEAWLSLGAISADAALMPVFATRAHMTQTQGEIAAILAKERREDLDARQAAQGAPKHPWHPEPTASAPRVLGPRRVVQRNGRTRSGLYDQRRDLVSGRVQQPASLRSYVCQSLSGPDCRLARAVA